MKKILTNYLILSILIVTTFSIEVLAKKAAIVIDFDTKEVLFEKKGRHKNQYIGRSIYNQSVFVENEKNLIGQYKNVLITRSTNFSLEGNVFS